MTPRCHSLPVGGGNRLHWAFLTSFFNRSGESDNAFRCSGRVKKIFFIFLFFLKERISKTISHRLIEKKKNHSPLQNTRSCSPCRQGKKTTKPNPVFDTGRVFLMMDGQKSGFFFSAASAFPPVIYSVPYIDFGAILEKFGSPNRVSLFLQTFAKVDPEPENQDLSCLFAAEFTPEHPFYLIQLKFNSDL